MTTTWQMWADAASEFAEEARRLKLPTNKTIPGRYKWQFWGRPVWSFTVKHEPAKGAWPLQHSVVITKKGGLVEVGVTENTPPIRPYGAGGAVEASAFEQDSLRRAFDTYVKFKTSDQ